MQNIHLNVWRHRSLIRYLLCFVLCCILLPTSALAHDELPPRPDRSPPPLKGATIRLVTQPYRAGLWTVVQWSDGAGNWFDVSGWQGAFSHPDHSDWFVMQNDFGKGPFRWEIYAGLNRQLLAVSRTFYLPTQPDEILTISVALPADCASGGCMQPMQPAYGQPVAPPAYYVQPPAPAYNPHGVHYGRQNRYRETYAQPAPRYYEHHAPELVASPGSPPYPGAVWQNGCWIGSQGHLCPP